MFLQRNGGKWFKSFFVLLYPEQEEERFLNLHLILTAAMSLQIPNSNIFPGDTNLCPAALSPVFPQILFSTILAPFHKSFKKSPFLTIQQGIDLVQFFSFTFHSSAATFSSLLNCFEKNTIFGLLISHYHRIKKAA